MVIATYIAFYAGTACYCLAAVLSSLCLRHGNDRLLRMSFRALMAGVLLFALTLVLRSVTLGFLPFTTMTDALNLLAVLTALVALFTVRRNAMPALLSFYLPPLAAICLVNAALAHRFMALHPRELPNSFLAVHVGLVFLAYAFFFVASMTSGAYLCQAAHLKHHRISWLVRHLPSLGELDAALFRLVGYGYPIFGASLVMGLIWANVNPGLLGAHWWLSPKVVLSFAMAAFYGALFHLRRTGRFRGPKLAEAVLGAFVLLIVGYLALSILNLRGYNFWSAGP